jgi:ribosomal protein L1
MLLNRNKAEITMRCKNALAEWVEFGHNEMKIRQLAKQSQLAFEPVEERRPSDSKKK